MYTQPLFRPPSEANSLILQITSGCSHNKCTFCYMYKNKQFRVKTYDEIEEHVLWAKKLYSTPKKIFLADGNVLCLKTEKLLEILKLIKHHFPKVERISSYSGPLDLIRKSDDELKEIKQAGLDMLYLGVESGSDEVLKNVNKGVNQKEMIEAGCKAKNAGFKLSCMIISGLGGKRLLKNHAKESSKVISEINPDYFALLTLLIGENSPMKKSVENGDFKILTPNEIMLETKIMLENIILDNCIFRANHVSNYVSLSGVLNKDKEEILSIIDDSLISSNYKPDSWRGL